MSANTISMNQVKPLINYAIDNNLKLQEAGKKPIAVGLIADAGIGKTSSVRQIAEERGMNIVKLNLAQLDEAGDILGFPQIEYECQLAKRVKDTEGNVKLSVLPGTTWLNSKQLESPDKNLAVKQTGKTRMGYAKPAWVPEYNENGTILLLDDFNRANSVLLNSSMEIILEQGYVSWTLPKKTTIILTANPDSGAYNVSSTDEAQNGRYIGFELVYDLDTWSQWAESANVDGRCINFVMSYSNELFDADENGNRICNPRSFVMFADMISGIKDWDNNESMAFINTIARGCFKDEGGRFSAMFSSFIRHKMHLLIQPKEMLLGKWEETKKKMLETLHDEDGGYRPDIASLLERRFSNYVTAWLRSDAQTPIATVKDRILDFINHDKVATDKTKFFSKDMYYHMLKSITSENRNQTNKLLYLPEIAEVLA